jgi:hypothetical protein
MPEIDMSQFASLIAADEGSQLLDPEVADQLGDVVPMPNIRFMTLDRVTRHKPTSRTIAALPGTYLGEPQRNRRMRAARRAIRDLFWLDRTVLADRALSSVTELYGGHHPVAEIVPHSQPKR